MTKKPLVVGTIYERPLGEKDVITALNLLAIYDTMQEKASCRQSLRETVANRLTPERIPGAMQHILLAFIGLLPADTENEVVWDGLNLVCREYLGFKKQEESSKALEEYQEREIVSRDTISTLKEQLALERDEVDRLGEVVTKYKHDCDIKAQEIGSHEKGAENYKATVTGLREVITGLTVELDAYKKDAERKSDLITELQTERNHLKADVAGIKIEVNTLADNLKDRINSLQES